MKGNFWKFALSIVAISIALVFTIWFVSFARQSYDARPTAKNVWVAMLKEPPKVFIVDNDKNLDEAHSAEYGIYANDDYREVILLVTLYGEEDEILDTFKFYFNNLERGKNHFDQFAIPEEFLLEYQSLGIKVVSYS